MSRCIPILLAAACLLPCCRQASDEGPQPARVTINGQVWYVELALTAEQQQKGLSGRWTMPQEHGMLFIKPRPAIQEFWMIDCHFPIDVAFADDQGRIVSIHTMRPQPGVSPDDLKRYSSLKPARFALEVHGGQFARRGIKVGDRMEFSPEVTQAMGAMPRE